MNTDLNVTATQLREELAKVEAELARQKALPEDQHLAEYLHTVCCHDNHTDGCGWFYEKDWTRWTHEQYLNQARELLETMTYKDVVKVIDILNR